MKVGYFEAMETPYDVIVQDLEFMEYEAQYGQQPANETKTQRGK